MAQLMRTAKIIFTFNFSTVWADRKSAELCVMDFNIIKSVERELIGPIGEYISGQKWCPTLSIQI